MDQKPEKPQVKRLCEWCGDPIRGHRKGRDFYVLPGDPDLYFCSDYCANKWINKTNED
jgi:hypothetical protein